MYESLVADDGGEFLARTGSFIRDRHLRTKWNRQAFQKLISMCGQNHQVRFWTNSVIRHAIEGAMLECYSN